MHGRMHPNYWQITILLVVDLCSSLGYFMMTQPLPIAGKLPIKTLVAKQLPTNVHVVTPYTVSHAIHAGESCMHVHVVVRVLHSFYVVYIQSLLYIISIHIHTYIHTCVHTFYSIIHSEIGSIQHLWPHLPVNYKRLCTIIVIMIISAYCTCMMIITIIYNNYTYDLWLSMRKLSRKGHQVQSLNWALRFSNT